MSVDYSGRHIDLLAVRTDDNGAPAQSLFDEKSSGEVCTGIVKLAQRWMLEFLTVRGSMPFLPNRGTDFMHVARQGGMRTEADVNAEFRFAVEEVRQNLVAEEYATMPDDERYASVTLDRLVLTGDGELSLNVTVSSRAGTGRSVVLPVAVSTLSTPFQE